jgi:hypothetical protein
VLCSRGDNLGALGGRLAFLEVLSGGYSFALYLFDSRTHYVDNHIGIFALEEAQETIDLFCVKIEFPKLKAVVEIVAISGFVRWALRITFRYGDHVDTSLGSIKGLACVLRYRNALWSWDVVSERI